MQTLIPEQVSLLRQGAVNETSLQLVDGIITQVTRLAIRDAQTGDTNAQLFLDVCAPDWQEEPGDYDDWEIVAMHALGIEF